MRDLTIWGLLGGTLGRASFFDPPGRRPTAASGSSGARKVEAEVYYA